MARSSLDDWHGSARAPASPAVAARPARTAVVVIVLVVCGLLGSLRPGPSAAAASEDVADDSNVSAQRNFWFDRQTGNQHFVALQQGGDEQTTDAAAPIRA